MESDESIVPLESIEQCIFVIRSQRVMLDLDLARLYGVSTGRLNEQVKRNQGRFPLDFMFQLNAAEKAQVAAICGDLRSLKFGPSLPYAFTEHGAVMLASVLNSPRAVQVSLFVVRAFVRLRAALSTQKEIAGALSELESRCDARYRSALDALRKLLEPAPEPAEAPRKPPIGFKPKR